MESIVFVIAMLIFCIAFSIPIFLLATAVKSLNRTLQDMQKQNDVKNNQMLSLIDKKFTAQDAKHDNQQQSIAGINEQLATIKQTVDVSDKRFAALNGKIKEQQKTINGIRDVLIKNQLTDAGKV